MKRLLVLVTTCLLLFATDTLYAQSTVAIDLAGYKQVPPVRSPGSGVLTVTLEADSLFVEGSFQDLRGTYRSAAIHYGSARESGNRLLALRADVDEAYKSGSFHREKNAFALRPSVLEALREGRLYIVVGSDRFQRGEIRAQIPPMP